MRFKLKIKEDEKKTLAKRFWIPVLLTIIGLGTTNYFQYYKTLKIDSQLQSTIIEKDSLSLVVDSLQQIHRTDSQITTPKK